MGYSPWRSSVRHDRATTTFTFTFHGLEHSGRSISFSCFCSVAQVCLTLCNCSTPGFLVLQITWSLVKLESIESVMPSNLLIFCHPPLLLSSIFLSIRVFSNELALLIRQPKYWSFSFSISPSNDYLGLISFRIDCCDLLTAQATLKSLLQHRSSKASIL